MIETLPASHGGISQTRRSSGLSLSRLSGHSGYQHETHIDPWTDGKFSPMRNLRLMIAVPALLLITACGASSSSDSTTDEPSTTTTVLAPDCSQEALDAAAGEPDTYVLGCSSNWAALQPESWECGEHCWAFIFKWDQSKWNLVAKCSQYSPLSADGSCSGMTGQITDGNYVQTVEYPPADVSCQIWANSLYGGSGEEPGCA